MRLFIAGICGFVGSRLALRLIEQWPGIQVAGIDNLSRPGCYVNLPVLQKAGVRIVHGDVRAPADLETIDGIDWVIDAAALPSVLAGIDGKSSVRQLTGHNLVGTLNLLDLARDRGAGFVLLSTSRVYSVHNLSRIPVLPEDQRYSLDHATAFAGVSERGINECFSTQSPVSLYGASKLASETMALEYAHAFGKRVLINRCGVMAGAGQFGTAEQGIFSYWIGAHAARRPLAYIGFNGTGRQVRDALHPDDLADLLSLQMRSEVPLGVWNVGGGPDRSMSLAELTAWCDSRFGAHPIRSDLRERRYDAPWIVMDAARATSEFGWRPQRSLESILSEIAHHHEQHPEWLSLSGVT